jgi:hypothetical protein
VGAVGQPVNIPVSSSDPSKLEAKVLDPSGKEVPSTISNKHSHPEVEFTPKVPGNHTVKLSEGGKSVSKLFFSINCL